MDYEGRDNFNTIVLRAFSLLGLITVLSGFLLWYTSSPSIRKLLKRKKNKEMKKYIVYLGILAVGLLLGWILFGGSPKEETDHNHDAVTETNQMWDLFNASTDYATRSRRLPYFVVWI